MKTKDKIMCTDCNEMVEVELYSHNEGCKPLYTCSKCGQFCYPEDNPSNSLVESERGTKR